MWFQIQQMSLLLQTFEQLCILVPSEIHLHHLMYSFKCSFIYVSSNNYTCLHIEYIEHLFVNLKVFFLPWMKLNSYRPSYILKTISWRKAREGPKKVSVKLTIGIHKINCWLEKTNILKCYLNTYFLHTALMLQPPNSDCLTPSNFKL